MRKLAVFIFFIFTGTVYSQVTYTSYFTQSYPTVFTSEIKDINRTIIFEPEKITITTEVEGGKEIEVLDIEKHDIINGTFTFFCKNRNNKNITIAIPENQEQIELIDYYYRSPKTNEKIQLRFYVEKQ